MSYANEINILNQHLADTNKKLMSPLSSFRLKMKKWKACFGILSIA